MDESQIVPCVTCGIGLGGIGDYEKSTDWPNIIQCIICNVYFVK